MTPVANYLRLWDYASAARVDQFVANSECVRQRIRRAYRRESEVIFPPVAVESFYAKAPEDYYLVVSELVAYKCVDRAVRVFARNGRKLRIVGDGPQFKSLRRLAAANIEFCGRLTDEQVREQFARCRAFLVSGEEDFGITMVEALASGKPVIALGRGGALEIVPEKNPTGGIFFREATDESLDDAIRQRALHEAEVDARALQAYASRFSEAEFARKMLPVLNVSFARCEDVKVL